jgi:hypothetical protein
MREYNFVRLVAGEIMVHVMSSDFKDDGGKEILMGVV